MKRLIIPLLSVLMYAGCMKINHFEKNVEIPKQQWSYTLQPEFGFEISDTVSSHNIFIVLRHTDAYAYKNIWLNVSTLQPGDSTFQTERFEFKLQQADGKWLGTGYGDIWEIRYPLLRNIQFKKKGTYKIRLHQIMRDDPLQHIMNAGIRIEKTS
ncbi:MAG: gliding motility lipoprotein GldH [Bacteroidota bacterium]